MKSDGKRQILGLMIDGKLERFIRAESVNGNGLRIKVRKQNNKEVHYKTPWEVLKILKNQYSEQKVELRTY